MGRFIVRRTISSVLVLFVVSVVTFAIFNLMPNGNPALRIAGKTATPQDIAAIEKAYGFNKPVYVQYVRTMKQIFTGQIQSYVEHVNVLSQIRQDLPVTESLVIGAVIIWLLFGIALGLIGGLRSGGSIDTSVTVVNFVGISAPSFVVGQILIYIFAFQLHILPSSGYVSITTNPLSWASHLILPWFSLAILYIGIYAQVLRSNVVSTLNEDFVRTARAKGLGKRRVLLHHVLRTSLIPLVSLGGLDVAGALGGGSLVIETVFSLHGVGQYAAQSIGALDVPPVMVVTLFGAFFVVIFSAIVDVLYAFLDPRIRLQ